MSPQRPALTLLVIVGFALFTNPLWLFPHEGETRYTYERSEIVVENGTLAYDGRDVPEFAEENSLTPVECQSADDEQPRACAFDSHLVSRGPVTVPSDSRGVVQPDFVRIGDGYYRRIHLPNGSSDDRSVTHDVERVTARTVLTESALDAPAQSGPVSDDLGLAFRIAVTGDAVTSFEDLDENELGRVYRQSGSYYTVVRTDERIIDHGLGFLRYETQRYLLVGAGFSLVVGALFLRTRF